MDPKLPGKEDIRKSEKFGWLRAVLACAKSDSAQANTTRSRIFREYLRENEFLSKTILACLSGAQMASIHEIKKWQKISWHCPFK